MKLPPYSKPLSDLLANGRKPNNSIFLYIGNDAWGKGRLSSFSRPTNTIALPINCHFTDYHWPILDCEILIIETSALPTEYIESLAQTLFDYGANKIVLLSLNLLSTTYKKDF